MNDPRTKRALALLLMVFVAGVATAAPPMDEARALQSDGAFEEAAAAWKQVVSEEPDNGAAWFNLGYCLHAAGHLEEAIEVHQKASRFDDFHGIALYNLGCAYALTGRPDDAFDALAAAQEAGFALRGRVESDSDLVSLRGDPRLEALLAREPAGGFQQFVGRIQQWVQQQAPQVERHLAVLAQKAQQVMAELAQDERFAMIAQKLQQLFGGRGGPPPAASVDRMPPAPGSAPPAPPAPPAARPATPSTAPTPTTTPAASLEQATQLQQAGRWLEAAEMFGAVAKAQPDDPRGWFGRAYCLHMAGEYEEAVAAHHKAAEFEPTRGIALYNLGCAYALLGKKDEAIEALRASHEAGFRVGASIAGDSDLDNLRDDPRFQKLVEEIGG